MKKTFALVLAVAMVMSLAAVSFAASNAKIALVGPYKYDGDIDSGKGAMKNAVLAYGNAAYWQILYGATTANTAVTDYEAIEKLKVKAKWEMGSDLVQGLSIVKKRIGAGITGSNYDDKGVAGNGPAVPSDLVLPTGEAYAYFVELKTVAKETTSDADIIGTLTFNKKATSGATAGTPKAYVFDDEEIDISVNLFYGDTWLTAKSLLIDGSSTHQLKWDTNYALKFDSDEEVELEFGKDPNEGTFTIDVSGQGKVFFKYDTKANDAIVAANPGAKMFFLNFNNPKFNRTGEFMYEMEDGAYVYEIVDGKLVTIPGAEYDEGDEAFYFYTRALGSYVFSDVELVDAVVDAPVVDAPTEVTNPGTGAAA